MRINKRHSGILTAFFMAITLPFFMTFCVNLVNFGFTERLVYAWMKTWIVAAIVAFPLILIFRPIIDKLVSKIVD